MRVFFVAQNPDRGAPACQRNPSPPNLSSPRTFRSRLRPKRDATIKAISAQEQTDASKRDAAFYLTEGMNFLHVGNYDEAVHAWRRALDMDPRNAAAANDIGIAIMFQKHPAAAVPWFQKAIALDPTLQIAQNNLAWVRQEEAKAAK